MSEYRSVLERAASNFAPLDLPLERVERGRDRRGRNRRIAAGVVGIAVFVAAVWVATSGVGFDRTQTPGVPGGAETGPAETGPTGPLDHNRIAPSLNGLPPEGAVPSTPETGELVAHFSAVGRSFAGGSVRGWVAVYADGRVISILGPSSLRVNKGPIYERRLTPDGVELVRSGAVEPGALIFDPYSLPAGAWEDFQIRAYVPSRYAICRQGEVDALPSPAQDLLRGKQRTTYDVLFGGPERPRVCFEVTTEEARTFDEMLGGEGYFLGVVFEPILPHGGLVW